MYKDASEDRDNIGRIVVGKYVVDYQAEGYETNYSGTHINAWTK
jgi:hypothetical protein